MEGSGADLGDFEERLGHLFRDRSLLEQALTHRSFAHEEGSDRHYERLEFLGDAVLGLVTAEWLYRERGDEPEGPLALTKSYLVSAPALAEYARSLGLGELLRLSGGEERSGGREKLSLLADALEAVFGASFLDGGYSVARLVIVRYLDSARVDSEMSRQDSKTLLQERLQADGLPLPEYRLAGESGPDHDKRFVVECWVGETVMGSGVGSSKKQAEQEAASAALAELGG